jgi:hypothetical protein
MYGWVYLIKNGDLYKIGITKNFDNRMRQLKPDKVITKLYSSEFRQLEREFHKRYNNVRIPQSEYFRLKPRQIREVKRRISRFYDFKRIIFDVFPNLLSILGIIFLIILLFKFLTINDINNVVLKSLQWMEVISFALSFFSLFNNSNKYYSLFNELKFRLIRVILLILFGFMFRFFYILLL